MAVATESAVGTVVLNADLQGTSDPYAPELTPTGVSPGNYAFASLVVDIKGRILYALNEDLGDFVGCADIGQCGAVVVGDHISVTNGEISIPYASGSEYGVVKVGTGFVINVDTLEIESLIATTTTLGWVIVPSSGHINIDGSGNISVDITTESSLGIMQVGTGLDVAAGIVSTNTSEMTTADGVLWGVISPGSNINVSAGEISVPIATTSILGVVQPDEVDIHVNGLGHLTNTYTPPVPSDATTTSKGIMQIGNHLNDTAGSGIVGVNISNGTTQLGVVKSADNQHIYISSNGDIDVGTNVSLLDWFKLWTANQTLPSHTTSPSTSYTPDLSLYNVFIITLTGNLTINNPTNVVAGEEVVFIIKQDATGGHTVTFDSNFNFKATPSVTTDPNAVDVVTSFAQSATNLLSQISKDYS